MMLLLTLLFACQTPKAPPSPFWNDHASLVVGTPTGPTCTIVAMHGYGATPEGLKGLFSGLETEAQVVLPRAPIPWNDGVGYAWFQRSREVSSEELAAQITAQADLLGEGLATMPTPHPIRGKPIITGFSQGGMLSFSVAARHPDKIGGALPLSGFLPDAGIPDGAAGTAPITAFHGEMDSVIGLDLAKRTTDQLAQKGWTVELKTYPRTNHNVPPPMRQDFYAKIAELCK